MHGAPKFRLLKRNFTVLVTKSWLHVVCHVDISYYWSIYFKLKQLHALSAR